MIESPRILSLETAVLGGSVWLGQGKLQLAARNGNPLVSQSNTLLSDIDTCLKQAGLSLPDIDLFACASGPGTFTGLRIGIATLKALAATLDRPCVGIPTLPAVAHAAGPSSATVALLPAGRGEVFAQMFSVLSDSGEYIVQPLDTPGHLSPQKLMERYGKLANVRWAGSGAHLQRDILKNYAEQYGFDFAEETNGLNARPTARNSWQLAAQQTNLAQHVAAMALRAFQTGAIQSPESLSAIYVRPSDAELKEQCR